jgi:hypothetical protein
MALQFASLSGISIDHDEKYGWFERLVGMRDPSRALKSTASCGWINPEIAISPLAKNAEPAN